VRHDVRHQIQPGRFDHLSWRTLELHDSADPTHVTQTTSQPLDVEASLSLAES
jgi:hypothetical protein